MKKKHAFILMLMAVATLSLLKSDLFTANADEEYKVVNVDKYKKFFVSEDNLGYTSNTATSVKYDSLIKVDLKTNNDEFVNVNFRDAVLPVTAIIEGASSFAFDFTFKNVDDSEAVYEFITDERIEHTIIEETYKLSHDSWGKTKTGKNYQSVRANGEEIISGEIGTGLLVMQKSSDLTNWYGIESSKFENGFYTTDVMHNFKNQTVEFKLDADEIKKGTYISFSFFYELKHKYTEYYTVWEKDTFLGIPVGQEKLKEKYDVTEETLNICEQITMFIIEDDIDVITINNITTLDSEELIEPPSPDALEEPEVYDQQVEQYSNYLNSLIRCITNNMEDGSVTNSGFRINVTNNKNIIVNVKKNGKIINLPPLTEKSSQLYYEFKDTGKYDIHIASQLGYESKDLQIYVDSDGAEATYARYFGEKVVYNGKIYGDEFINYAPNNPYNNQRIIDYKSEVPVFKNTLTLTRKAVDANVHAELYGIIKNISNGEEKEFNSLQVQLDKVGEYEVFFTNNRKYLEMLKGNENVSITGDVRFYKFRFKLVGDVNRDTINKTVLLNSEYGDLSIASPSDYKSSFYGVSRFGADKGRIIVGFNEYADALKYARDVVWSDIELFYDENGNPYWKIPDVNNPLGHKVVSYSGWTNADSVNKLSKQLVQKVYLDLTDVSTYLTLEKTYKELEDENQSIEYIDLSTIPLTKSIIVWYDEENRSNANAGSCYIDGKEIVRFIGKQQTAVLSLGDNGKYSEIVIGNKEYELLHDSLGIDSYKAEAIDENGNKFDLEYGYSLYEQFKARGHKSQVYRIIETNIYNVVTGDYYVYYLEENYQPSKLVINVDNSQHIISSENVQLFTCNEFEINELVDYIDPYTYVKIKYVNNQDTIISYYDISEIDNLKFEEIGEYTIYVIDRFGNHYSFVILLT